MAKTKRGRALWSMPSRGRGTCPVCDFSHQAPLRRQQVGRHGVEGMQEMPECRSVQSRRAVV